MSDPRGMHVAAIDLLAWPGTAAGRSDRDQAPRRTSGPQPPETEALVLRLRRKPPVQSLCAANGPSATGTPPCHVTAAQLAPTDRHGRHRHTRYHTLPCATEPVRRGRIMRNARARRRTRTCKLFSMAGLRPEELAGVPASPALPTDEHPTPVNRTPKRIGLCVRVSVRGTRSVHTARPVSPFRRRELFVTG